MPPSGISVTRALPPGGSGGLGPPGISVNYPCLASAAALPCPPLFRAVDLATSRCTDGEKSKNEPQRRTDLKIRPSKAKNLEEFDSDVRKTLAPRKSTENNEKPKKNPILFPKKIFGVEKSKFANRLKRALPKFRGDRSEVRGVNGRSKFAVAAEKSITGAKF